MENEPFYLWSYGIQCWSRAKPQSSRRATQESLCQDCKVEASSKDKEKAHVPKLPDWLYSTTLFLLQETKGNKWSCSDRCSQN